MHAKRTRKSSEPAAPSKPGTAIFAIRHAVGPAEAMINAERRHRALVKKKGAPKSERQGTKRKR